MVSVWWVDKYLSRNTGILKLVGARYHELHRVIGTTTDILKPFYEKVMKLNKKNEYEEELEFNFDESIVQYLPSDGKVLRSREGALPQRGKVGRGYRVTFASTINCAGIRIPTMIISEVKKEPEVSKWARKLCVFRTHEKAWINNSNKLWWVNTVFVPHVEKIRMENDWPMVKRALLYVDKDTTRNRVLF